MNWKTCLKARLLPKNAGKEIPLFLSERESPDTRLFPYETVSFDLFDTLVFRSVREPAAVFSVVENTLQRPGFAQKRKAAEARARQEKHRHTGSWEVTFGEIYRYLDNDPEAMETELAAELALCHRNPVTAALWESVGRQGKRRVITSDMYLPGETLARILHHCGFQGWEKLLVSCEYGVSKADGGLFQVLRREVGTGAVLHIGDHYESDVLSARKNGLDAAWYRREQVQKSVFCAPHGAERRQA